MTCEWRKLMSNTLLSLNDYYCQNTQRGRQLVLGSSQRWPVIVLSGSQVQVWKSERQKKNAQNVSSKWWKRKWVNGSTTTNSSCLYWVKAMTSCTKCSQTYRNIQIHKKRKSGCAAQTHPHRSASTSPEALRLYGTLDILDSFTVRRKWDSFSENWFYKQHL